MSPSVRATYRVQLTPRFGFDAAARLVPYLAQLGISHLYTSPLEEATPGSTHGYDVTDHQRVRDELGGMDGLRRLWGVLAEHDMGQVLDLVPNHMGIRSPSNRWWQDVLTHGPASRFAHHFDIDWDVPGEMRGRVALPFLDRPLDQAVQDGALVVERRADTPELVVRHHGDRWPASPRSLELLGLSATDCGERVQEVIDDLHRRPERLHEFLEAQHWRAVHWRRAPGLLNWRRFFDVTDLASVCVERDEVFDDVHDLLRRWLSSDPLAQQVVQGVRIDHVDGLVDPRRYLERLRAMVGPDRLVVVEKILGADETLAETWPVDGTTGYEVMARINEAFTLRSGAHRLLDRLRATTAAPVEWHDTELDSRRLVLHELLEPEVARVTATFLGALEETAGDDRPPVDPDSARRVIEGLAVHVDVYRTYPEPGSAAMAPTDVARIDDAVDRLRQDRPDLPTDLVGLAADLLTRRRVGGEAADAFVARFNQLSAPLAAKAVEDTAFYRYVPFVGLNEVGGDPSRPGRPAADLHADLGHLADRWPGTFVPLTTHDTKRGADVRARLGRFTESPEAADELLEAVARWHARVADVAPDPTFEWLMWQTVVGAWPIDLERLTTYATKAMREAKAETSWLDPDDAYEARVGTFLDTVLGDDRLVADIEAFVARFLAAGRAASLAQVVVATTAVGTPDVYQGDESWNLVLVDPDNRRPVDAGAVAATLDEARSLDGAGLAGLWAAIAGDPADTGTVKVAVLHRLLALRRGTRPALTAAAPYTPLTVHGPGADDTLAYRRGEDLVVVVPRRFLSVPDATIELPAGRWHDVLTEVEVDDGAPTLATLARALPVVVLARTG
jgi:(1->4)-alpha-D-glucan 1-alpha-D-glucosylmutase